MRTKSRYHLLEALVRLVLSAQQAFALPSWLADPGAWLLSELFSPTVKQFPVAFEGVHGEVSPLFLSPLVQKFLSEYFDGMSSCPGSLRH